MKDGVKLDQNTLNVLIEKGIITEKDIEKLNPSVQKKKPNKINVIDSVNLFARHIRDSHSYNTLTAYISTIEFFYQYYFDVDKFNDISNNTELPKISTEDIRKWFEHLTANGYSPSSIRRSKHALKKYFDFLASSEYMEEVNVSGIKIPKQNDVEFDVLKDAEIREMAEYATNLRDKVIVLLMYETGMRRQELIDCKKEHIDIDRGIVRIFNNDKFDRIGYFSSEVAKLVKQYIEEWEMEVNDINDRRYRRFITKNETYRELVISPYLFQTPRSEKISYSTIFKALKNMAYEYFYNQEIKEGATAEEAREYALERADTINTETLRHSRRTYLFASGKTLEQVQVLMGDDNRWVCKRYSKIAQELYPENYR